MNKSIAMTEEKLLKIIKWTTGNETGASSMELCRFMCGIPLSIWKSAPADAGDRARCIGLLNIIPEWWNRLPAMSSISSEWKDQITLIMEERYI